MSLSSAVRVAGCRRWSWRLGGAVRLLGGGKENGSDGKRAKRKPKFRIDNLADMNAEENGRQAVARYRLPLWSYKVSPLFPSLSGVTLSGHPITLPGNLAGNVSLVSVYMRAYGRTHCLKYSKPYEGSLGQRPDTALFEVSLVDMWVFRMLSRWMTRNLKKTMPPQSHDHFMLYKGRDVAQIRDTLQLGNSIIGYVFLLDREGRVRWRAHAAPTTQEIEALLSCSQQLLDCED